ncbi:MAG: two-component regulator propeller domain-containing protein [Chloroflexota bacterium]
MLWLLLSLANLFICIRSIGQSEPLNLTRYSEEDGLPSSQIYKIMIDRFGMIWVGTINGLARFDGYKFTRFYYNPNDSRTLKGLNVWAIFEDSHDRIWVATGPSYLNLYDPVTRSFRQFDFAGMIDHQANVELGISSINEDRWGRIWFGVTTNYNDPIEDGLLYYDQNTDKLIKYTGYKSGNIHNSTTDHQGNIWWLSASGLLTTSLNGSVVKVPTPDRELVANAEGLNDLTSDKKGNIWLISNHIRLYEYNPQTRLYNIYSQSVTNDTAATASGYPNIAADDKGNIWMGTYRGLQYFDSKEHIFKHINSNTNKILAEATILEIKFDSFGSLWIGTFSGGLFRYDERTLFKSYSYNSVEENSITSGWVNNLYEDEFGRILITTTGPGSTTGINLLLPETGRIEKSFFSQILPGVHTIFGLMEIKKSEYLLSTNKGFYKFWPGNQQAMATTLKGIPDSVIVYQFYKDRRDNLWLCTFNGLYRRKPGTESFIRYDLSVIPSANASSNEITNLIESSSNGLWLMTNNGLFRYDYTSDNIERHGFDKQKSDIFISQDINSLYEDSEGNLWVGTWQGGLSNYNVASGRIRTYTTNDGMPSMSVQGILGDEKNNSLWLSTFDGLSRFNLKTGQFTNFSLADGIQSQLFADGSYLKTHKGLFIFGGSNGITIFSPQDVKANSVPPTVLITDLKLFNESVIPSSGGILKKPIYNTEDITLAYYQNTLTIEFAAIHFSNPSKNKSSYILENYDTQWHEVGSQQFAYYSKLPPGKYVFRVKAANNNGVWNEKGATLKITITPPWWKTIPAYISYFILVLILIFLLDRYFRYRLAQKEKKRNLVIELEHAREIEKAYAELKLTQSQLIQSEKMASLGELTAGIAHEIKNPLNFVNNFSEVNTELIEELQDEIKSGNKDIAIALTNDIRVNEEKINFHGKRADAIVRGMLLHSRNGERIKEPVDLNAIADEYLRLSYHGMRAKDKTFNAKINTHFDESVGKINIVPDEIGRVIMNLLTNAFYAVNEKKKNMDDGYEPAVSIETRRKDKMVEIMVIDNGTGIPQQALDKIFHPFYTTKPAGQGTGLGLSMSYDIITKGHNGKIQVETKEGKGSEFRVVLPLNETP